jgi:hypothetical protein
MPSGADLQFARAWGIFLKVVGNDSLAERVPVMNPFLVQVFAVLGIYFLWRVHASWLRERKQKLQQRVAYMLWSAAQYAD